jgi:hypothetical protein
MSVYKERLEPHLADMPSNVLEGLQELCRAKRYAFMVPKEETTGYLQHLSCEVVYLPEGIFEMKYAFVFNVHSPYIGLFSYTCVPQVPTSGPSQHNVHLGATAHHNIVFRLVLLNTTYTNTLDGKVNRTTYPD